jgi:lipid A 3-O-deacylase
MKKQTCILILLATFLIHATSLITIELANEDKGIFTVPFNAIYDPLWGTYKNDGHLTNSLRIEFLSDSILGKLRLPRLIKKYDYLSLALEQTIYTPSGANKFDSLYVSADRPYAGYLNYLTRIIKFDEKSKYIHTSIRELHLGVIGPLSGAEALMVSYHKKANKKIPKGWENQLKNEFGITLLYEDIYAFPLHKYISIEPHYIASVGNIHTYLGAGGTLHIGNYGKNISPRFRYQQSGTPLPAKTAFSYSLFMGIESKLVLRNIFLDGNSFTESPSIEKENSVSDFQIGCILGYKDYSFRVMNLYRSPEYKAQPNGDQYLQLSLTIAFY